MRTVGKEGCQMNWYFVNYDYKVCLVSWDTMKANVDQVHGNIV